MSKKLKEHIIFWIALLASFSVIPFFQEENTSSLISLILQNAKRLPAMLVAAYVFNEILIPRYYRTKRYVVFIALAIVLFYLTAALDRLINVYVYEPLFRKGSFEQESIGQILREYPYLISGYLPPILIATFAMNIEKVLLEKQEAEKRNSILEADKNKAELNALKSQLHPHFLFNTLNNLYALTVQKSDKAPETVERLSQMLDYILYQCNDRIVPLDKEVQLLENYIELERLRYGDDIEVAFAKAYSADKKIAPLLLLSIVENAFKHGASGSLGTPEVHIDLWEEGEYLYFTVKNTKNEIVQKDTTNYTKGIGVRNVKQQLELLYSDFDYEINDQNDWYTVALRLNTAKTYD